MGAKRCFIGRRRRRYSGNTGQTKSTVVTISIKYATFRFVQPTLDGTERLGYLPDWTEATLRAGTTSVGPLHGANSARIPRL